MSAGVGLCVSVTVAVAFLAGAIVTGLGARRRAHLTLVAGTVGGLAAAVAFAVRLGEGYDLAAAGWVTPLHLWLARGATLTVLATLISGAFVLGGRGRVSVHRGFVRTLVVAILLAALTGGWMLLRATPL